MNVSYKWLRSMADLPDMEPKKFIHEMCMTGTEVTGHENAADSVRNVVVCRILSIEKHPDADKLVVCKVDTGAAEPLQIVTAAKNMKEGDLVPVALDGAVLAGGEKIKKGKLRGVESCGMFCSVAELGLTVSDYPGAVEDGLLILSEGTPGQNICDLLGLDDNVYFADIVTNRPDCLSMRGIAREAACTFRAPLRLEKPEVKGCAGSIKDYIGISVSNTELCPRYTARVVTDVKIAPSPLWLIERLRASGVRAINNIVDITNYVMLEYGQPMHAFDYSCVEGKTINVRNATEGEEFVTLDGQKHTLTGDMLVIADAVKPIALAGVMGGENSEIKDTTTTVVFESANFFGPSVRKTSKKLGMRTESSSRFEKGLDPTMTAEALDRACQLVEMLGAGKVIAEVTDINNATVTVKKIPLEKDWINGYLSLNVSEEEMSDILTRLGFTVSDGTVTVPSFRSDIENKYDISEEIARFYGYDNIPSENFKADIRSGGYTERQKFEKKLGWILRGAGLTEIMTYSFISPKAYDKIGLPENDPARNSLKILNPLGEDSSVMRTSALPGMLDVLARNNSFRVPSVYAYENAKIYLKNPDEKKLPEEKEILCLGFYGDGGDFFTMKGFVEKIAENLNILPCEYVPCTGKDTYHPGRAAYILCNGVTLGVFGQIHPTVAERYGFDTDVFCAEIDADKLFAHSAPEKAYRPLPKYPAVTRDIALICKQEVYSGDVEKKIKALVGPTLESISVFDVYTGAQVLTGHKSIAYALTLRAPDRTLQDSEIEKIMTKLVSGLEAEGITLRK